MHHLHCPSQFLPLAHTTPISRERTRRAMKFGKLIQALIEKTWPDWKENYLAYNSLKKRLKLLVRFVFSEANPVLGETFFESLQSDLVVESGFQPLLLPAGSYGDGMREKNIGVNRKRIRVSAENTGSKRRRLSLPVDFKRLEAYFKSLLVNELKKVNKFYLEKEQEYIIRLQDFKERIEKVEKRPQGYDECLLEVINLRKDVVILHGEMVLLQTYSSLNYTGLLKIVKKHDRMTGAWLRLSFIPAVRRQPFYTTEVLSRLVRDCESNLMSLFPTASVRTPISDEEYGRGSDHLQEEYLNQEEVIKGMHRSTIAALKSVRDLGRGSSTYNPFSVTSCSPANSENPLGSVFNEDVSSPSSSFIV